MLLRTPWESREQSRETGLDYIGEAAGRDGIRGWEGDFKEKTDKGSLGRGLRAQKADLGTNRNRCENGLMPQCATVASHSRPSTRNYPCVVLRESEAEI